MSPAEIEAQDRFDSKCHGGGRELTSNVSSHLFGLCAFDLPLMKDDMLLTLFQFV